MEIKEFIATLKKSNFTLTVENEKLILKGDKKNLSKDELKAIKSNEFVINYIKENKNELVQYLSVFSAPQVFEKRSKNIEAIYRLSGLQQGMLFHGLYDESAGAYIEQFGCDLVGTDIEILQQSWAQVIKAHSILRTSFNYDAFKVPVQCVYKTVKLPVTLMDYRGMSESEQAAAVKEFEEADRATPFDFKVAPLMRLGLLRLSEDRYRMIWTSHHILYDGWSLPVLMAEFLNTYESLKSGVPLIEKEEDKFEDYIRYLDRVDKAQEESYWRNYLQGIEQNTLLPFIGADAERNKGLGAYASMPLLLDAATTTNIQQYAQRHHLTVNTVIQGVWAYLLHHYTGNKNIAYGVVVSGRPDDMAGVEQRVGMYINTMPLHSTIKDGCAIVQWLQELQSQQVNSRQYQHVPLQVVQGLSGVQGNLFDTILTFENYPINKVVSSRHWALRVENIHVNEHTNYPLSILIDGTAQISIFFSYNASILEEVYVKNIRGHFENVLLQVIEKEDGLLSDLSLLTIAEQQELLVVFNDAQVAPWSVSSPTTALKQAQQFGMHPVQPSKPNQQTIIDLFEAQALKTPHALALVFNEEKVTYGQLNNRANQLARHLISKGIRQESLVPVCINRSIEMMIGILGILKAGAAYIPIDPDYPQQRISYLLKDTGATIIVTNKDNSLKIPLSATLQLVEIDTDAALIDVYPDDDLKQPINPHQLAYIIYTSGSTGKPKGVMVEHGSLLNYLVNNKTNYVENGSDNTGSYIHLSYTFDASLTAMYMPLLFGKPVVIGSKQSVDVFEDSNLLKYAPYDFIKITPAHLGLLLPKFKAFGKKGLAKKLVIGGEALHPAQFDAYVAEGIDVEIINEYGPTEATVGCTVYSFNTIADKDKIKNEIPIGKPVGNVAIYILDDKNNLVPVGVKGEICIGGTSVARGYLNLGELTAEKFIPDPFSNIIGARIYKTGDIGRWLPNGNISYLGRADDQVKIRGYRVELGEIENILQQCEWVGQGVVLGKEDKEGGNRLVSYYVPDLKAVKSKERELHYQRVDNWKELYETEYGQTEGDENIDPEFNIIGWNDSFTGGAIPAEQMKDWLDDIVQVVLSQPAGNVLEIGCGTGLIYYQLAGRVKKYIGCDLSRSSINQIKQRIGKGLRDYGDTELFTAPAHEVTVKDGQQVDTILLNSMVQYFPGEDYMNAVMGKCMELIKGKGRIIVGDVRDNRLLQLFKGRVRIQKLQGTVSVNELQWAVGQDMLKENELCFSPGYFYDLKKLFPQITHVDIEWKQAAYINELSLYRFTVIIYVGIEKQLIDPQWQSWNGISDNQTFFSKNGHGQKMLALKDVPNPRLWKERLLQQSLQNKSLKTAGDIMHVIESEDQGSIKINQLINLATTNGYTHRLLVNDDPLKVNLLFELDPSDGFIQQPSPVQMQDGNGLQTNIPLFTDISFLLQKDIRSLLHDRLPDYMVPSEFIALRELPLTNNGKVDRLFLSKREDRVFVNTLNYLPPVSEMEKAFAEIWKELLNLERVGMEDNFFELGGDSISTIQVVSRARRLGVELQPKDLFIYQTIGKLSAAITERSSAAVLGEQGMLTGFSGLLPIQQWWLQKDQPAISYFNQSVIIGIDKRITAIELNYAVEKLMEQHDALRFKYFKEDDNWRQQYGDYKGGVIIENLQSIPAGLLASAITESATLNHQSLDIEKGELVRVVWMQTPEAEIKNRLLIIVHHLAMDGVSWRVLLESLEHSLNGSMEGTKTEPGNKSSSYRQWYHALEDYGKRNKLLSQLSWWQQAAKNYEPLPVDINDESPVLVKDLAHFSALLDAEQTRNLLQEVPRAYHTEINDILLAALAATISDWSGKQKITIGLEGHGREDIAAGIDTSRTIGWFTTLYPLLLSMPAAKDDASLVKSVKEQLRRLPGKGIGYGVLKYINKEPSLQGAEPWDFVFNYLGRLDNVLSESKWFSDAAESTGAGRSSEHIAGEKISINAFVRGGELALNFTYSVKHFHETTVKKLSADYLSNLQQLIKHCVGQQKIAPVFTPSDYGLGQEITYQELDHFLSEQINGNERRNEIEGLYRLSALQQGMLFHGLYDERVGAYIEQFSCELSSPRLEIFSKSWDHVLSRHSILRSAFYPDTFSVPVQCVFKKVTLPLAIIDYRGMNDAAQENAIKEYEAAGLAKGFDFASPPLMRVALIRLSDQRYRMLWESHHILCDGWSMPILMEEFLTTYESLAGGNRMLPVAEDRYEDYIRFIERGDKDQEENYWRGYMKGLAQGTLLPFIEPTAERNKGVGNYNTLALQLDAPTSDKIHRYAQRHRLTVNTVMQGIWAFILHRYTGNSNVVYGAIVSGRPDELPGVEQRVGMYINTLPLHVNIKDDQPIEAWLQVLQREQVSSRQYQYTALHKIMEWTGVQGDLFDSVLVFENYPLSKVIGAKQWSLQVDKVQLSEQTNYPLSIIIENPEQFNIRFSYNTMLLDDVYVEKIRGHFEQVLLQVIDNGAAGIRDIKLMSPGEEQQMIKSLNDTDVAYPLDKTLIDLFEEQALKTPTSTALILEAEQLTYEQLNGQSNELANYLVSKGVSPGDLVPVCMERGMEMVIAILAILKTGAAYVPIDADYPLERIKFMLEDTAANILLTNKKFAAIFTEENDNGLNNKSNNPLEGLSSLHIVSISKKEIKPGIQIAPPSEGSNSRNPELVEGRREAGGEVCTIIYTSGSSGQPKGVKLTNAGIVNRLHWMWATYPFEQNERNAIKTSIGFVDHIWEIFGALNRGVASVIFPKETLLDLDLLVKKLSEENITRWVLVPSLLKTLLNKFQEDGTHLPKLKYWASSGETLPNALVTDFYKLFPSPFHKLLNIYGSSEVTADVSWYDTSMEDAQRGHSNLSLAGEHTSKGGEPAAADASSEPWSVSSPTTALKQVEKIGTHPAHTTGNAYTHIPIGKPISNTSIYIVDKTGQLLPMGIAGEICVAGVQVAQGYLNLPELSAERFTTDPFSKVPGSRMFRTGDFGRWLANGNIEYLGRIDGQVKIRGNRVELGEIENALLNGGIVKQCVVLARADSSGNNNLVSYVVADEPFNKQAATIFLKDKLPEYMVPYLWVQLESLPLTTSGKIDTKALPSASQQDVLGIEYIAPATQVEEQLAAIWRQLLAKERVGIHDNFFELGGHSLLAMRVVSFIRKELEVELAIKDLFSHPTIASLAAYLQKQNKGLMLPALVMQARPSQIPLSFSQERLWFIDRLEGSLQYHIPVVLRLKGNLDKAALAASLQTIINRHEVLRTFFREEDGQAYQSIHATGRWAISFEDGAQYNGDADALKLYIQSLIKTPYNLSKDYPVRGSLISVGAGEYLLVVTMHHIASDAWSISIIVKELVELYNARVQGRAADLLPIQIQYADYAIWQRNYLQGAILDKKIIYWKQKLEGLTPLQLPTDHSRPLVRGNRGASLSFSIDKGLPRQLNELCRQQGASMFMVLLAAFKVLLYRYSGQQDISVGTSIASRQQKELEGLIGFFVNTLALRDEVNTRSSFNELLQQVRHTTLDAYEHQDVPFEKVVEAVITERDMGRSPLFQVMLVLQNTPAAAKLQLGDVELSAEPFATNISKFDITFFINENENGLHGTVEYNTDLYNAETIQRITVHFETLLRSVAKAPHQKIGLLPMLKEEEQMQLLEQFNNSEVAYPANKSITGLFEEQAAKTPGNTAIVFEDEKLTFQQLNERSNQLAHYLQSRGVQAGALVPLYMERSAAMMIAMLGIMKAGAAYVPIDTVFPQDRIRYMLQDCGAKIMVSNHSIAGKLALETGVEIIETDDAVNQPNQNLTAKPIPDQLAYVIYTSGSTGMPKGVMIAHRSLVDYYYGLNKYTQISECKTFALVSTIATDLGNTVIYASLLSGGTLHIFSKASVGNIEYLHHYFNEHTIDCLKIVPSHWKALQMEEELLLPKKLLVFGGEALQSSLVEDIRLSGSRCRVVNHYGPTETTIGKLLHPVNPDFNYSGTIPIGKPFSNTRVYVLSNEMQLCPAGIPGQLYIAGDGLAKGYVNNKALTNEKFISDPFSKKDGSKMYATGDQVKWLRDGNIEFIGRVDGQIKIRGYRVELGEIEITLQQSGLVSQAVVLATDDKQGDKRLAAYIVPQDEFDKEAIIVYLKEKLPEYMVPTVIVQLQSLPLTPNGKIDRKALPDPGAEELLTNKYTAPRNETEAKLATIWEDILEVQPVGIHDDFFELGGHSLLAVRLISAIRKAFVVEMPIGHIFDHPTVALLAAQLAIPTDTIILPVIEKVVSRPLLIPLSFSQERLWFIHQMGGSQPYHIPSVLRLTGKLNIQALVSALQNTVNRHEVLRTVYREQEGQPYQFIKDKDEWQLQLVDGKIFINDEPALRKYIGQLINKPYNLAEDYMLRAALISLRQDDHLLVATLHHIASDGWSRPLLVNDFAAFYQAYEEGRRANLPILPVQYADYAMWQRAYLQGAVLENKIDYWKEKLKGVVALQLPIDFPRPAIQSSRGAIAVFNINKDLSDQLQLLSKQHGATLFMALLAAFKVLLYRYSGQPDICVGTPIAGRQQQEVEGLIGFFVNTLALRTWLNGDASFIDLLQQVKQTTLEAYQHQELPFEKVVEVVVKERDMGRSPLFQVMLVLQNTPAIPELHLGDMQLTPEAIAHTVSTFDLTLSIKETPQGLQGYMEYCTDLYEAQTIIRMLAHFEQLLQSIVDTPAQSIGVLPMLSEAERRQLLISFNDTKVDYPMDKSIVALFEEQALMVPDKIAVVFEQQQISYNQLNERSNQIANYLRYKGVTKETLVPICIERSVEMIIGLLAVLKAGGAYVPIDYDYPAERIKYMLDDTGASVMIGSSRSRLKMPATNDIDFLEIDGHWDTIAQQSAANVNISIQPHQLAYVIYTSGSTGRPKGVMIEHASLLNYVLLFKKMFSISAADNVLQQASASFDTMVEEIYPTLISGGCIYLLKDGGKDIVHLKQYIENNTATILSTTPMVLEYLNKELTGTGKLRYILSGGDVLYPSYIDNLFGKAIIANGYGPSEATVCATFNKIENLSNASSIGKPIDNASIYIVSREEQLVPVGVAGEIWIGGAGLARGYLKNETLTNEKFIANPFSIEAGARLYKTGDAGRWLPDGTITYLGRIDEQVKIRGYRIELGEIETALQQSGLVSQSVVLAKEDNNGNKRLVGYVVPQGEFDKQAIIDHLKTTLPEYMVPALWVPLQTLPVTPNGKVDRKALPGADASELTTSAYTAPGNQAEVILVEVWQQLLKVKQVGIHDNFFELGGHSLMVIKMVSVIKKRFNLLIPIPVLFQFPTIQELAAYLDWENEKVKEEEGNNNDTDTFEIINL